MKIFDYAGKLINAQDEFDDNVSMLYAFDSISSTNYIVFRVNKKRIDGSVQYPFMRYVNPMKTAYDLANDEGWLFTTNGGVGTGLMIENSVVINDASYSDEGNQVIPLSINQSGDLGYLDANYIGKGQQYVNNGVVSAMCGFFPIIDDYDDFDYPTWSGIETQAWQYAQRQIIGQFGNGDYMFIVSEGRSYDNSVGFTMTDAQRICKTLGVKFAYNLDGGGSTQTVFGKRNVNLIYEGTSGRKRGTFVVFNGTSTFAIPNR